LILSAEFKLRQSSLLTIWSLFGYTVNNLHISNCGQCNK